MQPAAWKCRARKTAAAVRAEETAEVLQQEEQRTVPHAANDPPDQLPAAKALIRWQEVTVMTATEETVSVNRIQT